MATSISVVNGHSANTLRIKVQIAEKDKNGKIVWKDKPVDGFLAPKVHENVWLEGGKQRVIIEEMPT